MKAGLGVGITLGRAQGEDYLQFSISYQGKSEIEIFWTSRRETGEVISGELYKFMYGFAEKNKLEWDDTMNNALNIVKEEAPKKLSAGGGVQLAEMMAMTDRIVSYGPALGMDVYVRGTDSPFRLKNDDFVNQKNFSIWFMSTQGKSVGVDKDEWRVLVSQWVHHAELQLPDQDPLAPSAVDDMIERIAKAPVFAGVKSPDAIQSLLMGSDVFFLLGDKLLVSTRTYNRVRDLAKVTHRKMRQFFEPYLARQDSMPYVVKDEEDKPRSHRFWVFDWNALCDAYGELRQKEIVRTEGNIEEILPDARIEHASSFEFRTNGGPDAGLMFRCSIPVAFKLNDERVEMTEKDTMLLPSEAARELEKNGFGRADLT